MACFHPISAWQLEDGTVVFVERSSVARSLTLPCGQCVGCRLERSRQWAVRCVHESQMHDFSVFVTLTYDNDHLRSSSLIYRDFQLFMKRLRKAKGPVRFYMCGEYGEGGSRPHFHACLFGVFFEDREVLKVLPSGSTLYTSEELKRLWPFGFSSIGDVTFESAAYVARYVMKKVTGSGAADHYLSVSAATGEVVERVPEFNRMSLKPGIGAKWFEKYAREVYPRDFVVLNGVKMKPPKYYDKVLEKTDLGKAADVEFGRLQRMATAEYDNSPERLKVREVVTKSRLSFKKRSIL